MTCEILSKRTPYRHIVMYTCKILMVSENNNFEKDSFKKYFTFIRCLFFSFPFSVLCQYFRNAPIYFFHSKYENNNIRGQKVKLLNY